MQRRRLRRRRLFTPSGGGGSAPAFGALSSGSVSTQNQATSLPTGWTDSQYGLMAVFCTSQLAHLEEPTGWRLRKETRTETMAGWLFERATAAADSAPTLAFDIASPSGAWTIVRTTGVSASDMVGSQKASASSHDMIAVTTAATTELLVSFVGVDFPSSPQHTAPIFTQPTSWTKQVDFEGTSDAHAAVATYSPGSAGSHAGTWSGFPASDQSVAFNVAVGTTAYPVLATQTGMWLRFWRHCSDSNPSRTSPSTTASRFKYLMMGHENSTNITWRNDLKTANSGIQIGLYKETPYTRNLETPANGYSSICGAGVSEEQAAASNWYARNASSGLVQNPFTQAPDNTLDPALSAVRTAWATNVNAALSRMSIDYVFSDDTNFRIDNTANGPPAAYPTNADWWNSGMRPFIEAVGPNITGGYCPNLAGLGEMPQHQECVRGVDLVFHEHCGSYNDGSKSSYWAADIFQAGATFVSAKRKYVGQFIGTGSGDAAMMRYGLASLLLVADPLDRELCVLSPTYSVSGLPNYSAEHWMTEFTYDIGAPTGARKRNSDGTYVRYFQKGVAIVNPSHNNDFTARAGSLTVNVTNGPYTGSGLTSVNAATLAAGNGVVMTKD